MTILVLFCRQKFRPHRRKIKSCSTKMFASFNLIHGKDVTNRLALISDITDKRRRRI